MACPFKNQIKPTQPIQPDSNLKTQLPELN
jgi:hypothetical protein